jgi:hypothetical protein
MWLPERVSNPVIAGGEKKKSPVSSFRCSLIGNNDQGCYSPGVISHYYVQTVSVPLNNMGMQLENGKNITQRNT